MSNELKKYILSQVSKQKLSKERAKKFINDLTDQEKSLEKDIAIIGTASRFAKAEDPESFWQQLRNGKYSIREFPIERYSDSEDVLRNPNLAEFVLGNTLRPEDVPYVHAESGYLNEVDKFDAAFFGISPMEATHMDPEHRMALEVAWEAMEDSGYGGQSLKGSRTGVYIGKEGTYANYYSQRSEHNQMQLTGSWESLMASRITYLFDFKSPSMVVDTACSSGLVSVHMAAQALIAGECDTAIAGGTNLALNGYIKAQFLEGANLGDVESTDSRIKPFDAHASGTMWGEGVGMVILKPLNKAIEDRDQIRAVIKGSAINNDGASKSLTSPNAEMQKEVIKDAWKKAGIDPRTISYVEAHGTGTVLGDPIEIKALNDAFRKFTPDKQFCSIGSLKTNIGHLIGASGTASLIKVIKSIEHQELAPMINFETPNPYINFTESPLFINNRLQPWDSDENPRRAAINSFGFSRTNCHMVIEEPPVLESVAELQPRYCLTISARNERVLEAYLNRYGQFSEESSWTLADLCYTSNIGRGHYEHRVVFIAESKEELRQLIKETINKEEKESDLFGVYSGHFRIVNEKKEYIDYGEITRHNLMEKSREANEKLKEYLDGHSENNHLLMEVCSLYAQGADVNWNLFYQGENRSRIQAPVYPLERIRYWARPKVSKEQFKPKGSSHPLLERKTSHSSEKICYETVFNINKHWVLNEHRIGGKAVLPNTSYLEMVRFAASEELGQKYLEFSDVFFLTPLFVADRAESLVRLTLVKISSGFSFSVKEKNRAGEWVLCVEGKISVLENNQTHEFKDLSYLKSKADTVTEPTYGNESDVFTFGPHWDTVSLEWRSEFETLVRLELPDEFKHELAEYHLHPSILDNAVNLNLNTISREQGKTFLPFNYKNLKFYAPLTKEVYAQVRLSNNHEDSGETMTYDVDMLDGEGRVLAKVTDYTVKLVKNVSTLSKDEIQNESLKMNWVQINENTFTSNLKKFQGNWALVSTPGSRSKELENALIASGLHVTKYHLATSNSNQSEVTYFPDKNGFDAILTHANKQSIEGILFASDFTMEDKERNQHMTTDEAFQEQRTLGVDALFHLSKRLLIRKMKQINKLKVLTRDGWVVDGNEHYTTPLSASTAGLAKVIGQEYHHIGVDVTDASGDIPISNVINECFEGSGLRALRPSGNFVEELKPYQAPSKTEFTTESEGVYLITGGLGGLGMSIAEHLARKGDVQIVLLGRRSMAPKSEWKKLSDSKDSETKKLYHRLIQLSSRTTNLEYISIDVSKASDVESMDQDLRNRYGHINGVFHAAGVAGDGFLILKEENQFKEVLNPKLNGSMNLIRILPKHNNSFMVLFSSLASLIGGEGQGDYTAANAFLDSLADAGSLLGLRISAVNWPNWKNLGMTSMMEQQKQEGALHSANTDNTSAALAFDDDKLFSEINVEEGLKWLDGSITNPQRRLVPSPINISKAAKLKDDLPFRLDPALTENLLSSEEAVDNEDSEKFHEVDVSIKGTTNPTETQLIIGNAYGQLLGLDEIDIYTSFQDMGGNSLMTTQLLDLIEDPFPDTVDISDLFSYPTVKELSDFIDEKNDISTEKDSTSQNDIDEDLLNIVEQELEGTEYLDDFLDNLKKGEKR